MLPAIDIFKERFGSLRYFFAPMAGISDTVFRLLMREMGAQAVVSELLSAEGIVRGGKRTLDMMAYDERERPIGIQIFGSSIPSLAEAAKIVQSSGVDFVDINFGCPVKKVVCDGGGAAWLKDPVELGKLLTEVKAGLRIPLTIKVRTGWDEKQINIKEVVHVAAESGVSWVAIHGRTRAQGYSGHADWELIRQVAASSRLPIIGNGDVTTARIATDRINQGYSHGVMIGRGALKNPWIFREIQGFTEPRDFLALINRHFEISFEKTDSTRTFLSLKKFMSWYATGLPGASAFRAEVFGTRDVELLRKTAMDYFTQMRNHLKVEDDRPFLMGGHG